MQDIWLAKDPDRISDILGEQLAYYETPLTPPLTTIEDVVREWQVIKSQNIDYVEIDILYEHNNTGTALWKFKEFDQPLHTGCYFLRLDEGGKCQEFRQWWHVDDEDRLTA